MLDHFFNVALLKLNVALLSRKGQKEILPWAFGIIILVLILAVTLLVLKPAVLQALPWAGKVAAVTKCYKTSWTKIECLAKIWTG